MSINKHLGLLLPLLFISLQLRSQEYKTERVFLITYDGLRWQELFGGVDEELLNDSRYVSELDAVKSNFWAETPEERRQKLFPFFWSTVAEEGQLLGNRWKSSEVDLTNDQWFSYPGYNEILTGMADPDIRSNAKKYNSNKTILEIANESPSYAGKVAAFGSWDVFPYIINDQRSKLPVNAGFQPATGDNLTEKEIFLNQLQEETPSPWSSVRLDVFTHHFALEYIQKNHPDLVYISYGETDDFAHDGDYDQYLYSARRTDHFISKLWEYCQNDPYYAGKTTFIITTDHGRGDQKKNQWTSHGANVKDAYQTWMVAFGPDTPALGERKNTQKYFTNQVARTVTSLLGISYDAAGKAGNPIEDFLKKN